MAEIDSLEIKISGSTQKANQAIDSLIDNLGKLTEKLVAVSQTPIKINISTNAEKDINSLIYSVQKALDNTRVNTSKIGEELAKSFNITGKKEVQNISNQFTRIIEDAVNKFDGSSLKISGKAINELAENIARSGKIAKGELSFSLYGMESEYKDFYDYFKTHKLYISDFLKTDIGKSEFTSLLQTNLSNITRDATKGINLNAYWEELTARFPTILPKGIDNAADQVITVLQKIGEVRSQIKPIGIENLFGKDYESAIENIKERIVSSLNKSKETILKDATKIYNAPQEKITIPIEVNEDAIVKQVQSAIAKASRVKYEPLKINLDIDTKKIKSDLSAKLKGIDLSELSDTFAKFKNISFDAKPIVELSNAISILGRKTATAGIENVPVLISALKEMISTFGKLPAVDSSIVQMTQSLATLAQRSGNLQTALREVKSAANETKTTLADMPEPKIFNNINSKSITDFEKNFEALKKSINDIIDSYGGISNVTKGTFDTPIQELKRSIEELKQSFPGATELISVFEKELQKMQELSAGLTKERIKVNVDTNSIDRVNEKIAELAKRFENRGADFKFTGNFEQLNSEIEKVYTKLNELITKEQEMISAGQVNTSGFEQLQEALARVGNKFGIMQDLRDRTEEFNQSLQNLKVPPINEENLAKLQNALRKTEEDTEKLRTKLSNAITMGRIVPNIDDSGFRRLTEQIALSEKQAEALRAKIQEVSRNTNKTGSATDKFKLSLSGFSGQAGKTSSATSILEKNIKKLSSVMSGINSSVGKAISGMKSFARQALSAAGIYLSIYGAVRGIKKSLEIASDLTEVQNVVDVTFGDMAYKVEEFAETSIEKFGMSELSLKQYASRFQSMGTNMGISSKSIEKANEFLSKQTSGYVQVSDSMADMSLNLTKLTADMASLYNVEQKVVAEKLASIFTGQSRPLRDFGLDLTQATLKEWALKNGIDANIQSMSQAEKTMLRYQYVLSNTLAAQGDFERTQYTWANQTRILKQNFEQLAAVIGGVLVNAFKPIVIAANEAMSHIIAFAEAISNALGKIFGWKFEKSAGAGGLGGLVDDASVLEDDIDDATKAAKKLKTVVLGIDELNINAPDDGGKKAKGEGDDLGVGGILGEGIGKWVKDETLMGYESEIDTLYKLGEYIGNTLKNALGDIKWEDVYQSAENFGSGLASFLNGLISPELFGALGTTVASSLNAALHFLDSFGLWFDWKKFGDSLAAGLLGFLNNIQWETALSAATHWGKGIANTLNYFITPETFSATGNAVAMTLNTAIQFALSFGQAFDFKNLGKSIAAGINNFFATFSFGDLAATLNVWATGILDTVITVLDKTDWDMIGAKIGQFLADIDLWAIGGKVGKALWKTINAGIETFASSFSKAPVETTLLALVAIPKALKAIANSKLIKGIQSLMVYFGKLASTAKLVVTALAGNATSLSALMTQFPRFGSVVNVAAQALAEFRSGLSSQGLTTGFNQGLTTLNNGITNLRNSLSGMQKGAITAVAAFAEFTVISDVFEGFALGSENLVAGIGKIGAAAGIAAAAMYTALGPAGIVIAVITGVVAAIKGINDAFDEIHAENIGNAINNALTKPGGTPISEVAQNVSESISSIGDSFSTVSEKSSALGDADKKIEDIKFQIELVRAELEAGTITAEEAAEKFNNLLSELQTAVSTKIGAINEYMLSAFGEGGTWGKAWENAGFDASESVGQTLGLTAEMQTQFNNLVTQLAEVDPNSPEWANLQAQLYGIIGETNELETAMSNFEYNMNSIEIDYSKLVGDGQLDSTEVEAVMTRISESVQGTYNDIEFAGEEMAKQLNNAIESAKKVGDNEAVEYFSQMLEELPAVIDYQKGQVASQAADFTNVLQEGLIGGIDKVIQEAQSNWKSMSSSEIFFSGFADESEYVLDYVEKFKANTIDPMSSEIESMMSQLGIDGAGWSSDAMDKILDGMWEFNEETREAEISKNFTNLVQNAIEASEAAITGTAKDMGHNIDLGLDIGIKEGDVTTGLSNKLLEAINIGKEILGVHSPSTVFEEIGNYVVEGFLIGLEEKWEGLKEWWSQTAIVSLWNEITPWFSSEKWSELGQGILDGITAKWEELKTWWNESAIATWWEEDVSPWFSLDKWLELAGGIKDGIGQKWSETSLEWGTNIKKWWNDHVSPWFTKKKWEDLLKEIPNVFKNAFKNAANGAIGFLNGVINGIEKMINNAIKSLADMAKVVNKIPGVSIQFETPSISLPKIPQFEKGGITLGHTFAEISEFNKPEAVLPLTNRRAMGMIANSIMDNADYSYNGGVLEGSQIEESVRKGVRDAVAEILAPYLADIVQNTRESADKDMVAVMDTRAALADLRAEARREGYVFRS